MSSVGAEGSAALAALDRALEAAGKEGASDYAEATEHLCAMRELLIARKGPGRSDQLARLNGIISSSLSGHFPLGAIPEPLIRAARASLQGLLSEVVE